MLSWCATSNVFLNVLTRFNSVQLLLSFYCVLRVSRGNLDSNSGGNSGDNPESHLGGEYGGKLGDNPGGNRGGTSGGNPYTGAHFRCRDD